MSVIGGYKGELDMERPPNDEEVAAASIAGTINLLGGDDDPDVKAILDATEDPNMIAEKLSAAHSRKSHFHMSVIGGYKGELDMERPPNDEEVAAASIASVITRLGGVDDPDVKAILDATEDPNMIAEQLSAALSRKSDKTFFSRVEKLNVFKEEHGHLNVHQKDSQSLYQFCNNLRNSRRAIIAGEGKIYYPLDDDRIAALDAIGFDWKLEAKKIVIKSFFSRVEELNVFKEEHGHLNVHQKDNQSLYLFCNNVRYSRRAIIAGEGKIYYPLDDDRIAALNAIGFDWQQYDKAAMKAEEAAKATSTKVMVSEILHSNSVEAGKAISIMVAPGERLGLNVTVRPGSSRGARIDAINSGCPFADKVTVGDTIMTINYKETRHHSKVNAR
jgi:RNA binding exosome subunit